MTKPIPSNHEFRELERRVNIALEAASASATPAPEGLLDFLLEALARLRALAAAAEERPDAIESVERALAALEAWHRWRPGPTSS